MEWPNDYSGELRRRLSLYRLLDEDEKIRGAAVAAYSTNPVLFISDNCWVYEPRNANKGEPVKIPVVLFPKQVEFVQWLHERYLKSDSQPVEKSRDSGASWISVNFAVWLWLFTGASIGFGSRKEEYVDKLGKIDSLFEKIRYTIDNLPDYLTPYGFQRDKHSNYMRLMNPDTGAIISGEAGDNIGRGGRNAIYFIDESAHLQNQESVIAALTANTDCKIDISTPLINTVFNKTVAAASNAFVFDVYDVPWHTKEWVEAKRKELEDIGLGHVFKQEYLRDPNASPIGSLIDSKWIRAAIDAHKILDMPIEGSKRLGFDPADGSADENLTSDDNAICFAHGNVTLDIDKWQAGEDELEQSTGRAYNYAIEKGVTEFYYDCIGVGASVGSNVKRLNEENGSKLKYYKFRASDKVFRPDKNVNPDDKESPLNKDHYENAKSQMWFELARRFKITYHAIVNYKEYYEDDIISISSECSSLEDLITQLSTPRIEFSNRGKVMVESKKKLLARGIRSPNDADAFVMANSDIKIVKRGADIF